MAQSKPLIDDVLVRRVFDHLSANARGKGGALPARTISAELELGPNGDRILRAAIHRANEINLLIVADNDGYFVPESMSEVEEAIGRLRSQAAEMMDRARRIEALASQTFYSTQMGLGV